MIAKIKKLYDNLYKDNPLIFGDSSVKFLNDILKIHLPKPGRALDIGVGDGATSVLLADKGFFVDAIDVSDYAFSLIKEDKRIKTYNTSISDFPIKESYKFVNFPLVSHHISSEDFNNLVISLQIMTDNDGLHVYRLFTVNSDFYKNSEGFGFYDDYVNLDNLYKDWKVIYNKNTLTKSSVGASKNELREVAFLKV